MHELYLSIDQTSETVAAFLEIWRADILENVVYLGSRGRKKVAPPIAFRTLANFSRKRLTDDSYALFLKSLKNPETLMAFLGKGYLDDVSLAFYDNYTRVDTQRSLWRLEVDLKLNTWEGWIKLKRILQEKDETKTSFSLIRGLLDNKLPYFFLHNEVKDTFLYLGLYDRNRLKGYFSAEGMLQNLPDKYAGSVQLTLSELEELKYRPKSELSQSLFFFPLIASGFTSCDSYSSMFPCFFPADIKKYRAVENHSLETFIGEDIRTPVLSATLIERGHFKEDQKKFFFLSLMDYHLSLAVYSSKGIVLDIPSTKDQFNPTKGYHLEKKRDLTLFEVELIAKADTHEDLAEVLLSEQRVHVESRCIARVGKLNKSGEWFALTQVTLDSVFKKYKKELYNNLSKIDSLNYVKKLIRDTEEDKVCIDPDAINIMREAVEEPGITSKVMKDLDLDWFRGIVTKNSGKSPSIIEDKNKRGISSMFDKMFKKVPAVVDLLTGQAAIKNSDQSLAVLCSEVIDGKEVFSIEETPFENLAITLPGIALRRPLNEIEKGDIHVFGNNEMGFVIGVSDNTLQVMYPDGKVSTVNPVKNRLVGQSGFLVVSNFANMHKGDNSNLMLMLALSQGQQEIDDQTRMMLMLSMSRGKELDPQMLMMMSMGKGHSSMEMLLPLLLMRG